DFLESGHAPRGDFMAEECNNSQEAAAIASHYERIISSAEAQLQAQSKTAHHKPARTNVPSESTTGFCIYIDTLFQGPVISAHDGKGYPLVFPSMRDAHLEIVDSAQIRMQQFIDGERDFDDAITIDEYV